MSDPLRSHAGANPIAADTAASLKNEYGDAALTGAKVALELCGRKKDADGIALWSEVCAILATDQRLIIGPSRH